MKNLLFLFLLFIPTNLFAEEFSPYVKINTFFGDYYGWYSGHVHKIEKDNIKIITCAHAYTASKNPRYTEVILFSKKSTLKLKAKVLKVEPIKDIMYLQCSINTSLININCPQLASERLNTSSKFIAHAYGYNFKTNEVMEKILTGPANYESYVSTFKNIKILRINGECIEGNSGGPLIYQDKVYGILSACKNGSGYSLFTPSEQIIDFLKD